jgi:phospholipid-binding lipoprotein MlaA
MIIWAGSIKSISIRHAIIQIAGRPYDCVCNFKGPESQNSSCSYPDNSSGIIVLYLKFYIAVTINEGLLLKIQARVIIPVKALMKILNCIVIISCIILSFEKALYSEIIPPALESALPNEQSDVVLFVQEGASEQISTGSSEDDDVDSIQEDGPDRIADPLESVNRAVFHFNDKLYFWLLKPVARGYAAILPEDVRISVRNFFSNVSTPVRLVNNLLQLKIKGAGNELLRFGVNSTMGMLGLYDVAKNEMGISMNDEDFGQTLGVWGLGPGIFINWPIIGPSSLRDSAGYAGDYFLDPVNYLNPIIDRMAVKAGDGINRTSLSLGDYEGIKKDAIDPYNAVKDIYYQYRQGKIDR